MAVVQVAWPPFLGSGRMALTKAPLIEDTAPGQHKALTGARFRCAPSGLLKNRKELNNHRLKPLGLRYGLKVRIRVG